MVAEKMTELLQKHFGLNLYEARAYVALVGFGVLTPAELGSVSEVPAPRTYDTLRSLEKKGFAMSQPGKENKYRPVHPKVILEKYIEDWKKLTKEELEAKEKAKEELLEMMAPLMESEVPKYGAERVWVVRGIKNLVVKMKEMFEEAESELLLGDNGYISVNLAKEITGLVDKGLAVKVLVPKEILKAVEKTKVYDYYKDGKLELRVVDKLEVPMAVTGDQVFFVLEDPAARVFGYEPQVWIKDFRVANIFREKFNELWEKGQKP
ncbi:TrmB family transcriptional regulator [Thermococci archaeon]|nr:MAG: TrmB family transcriptional regulator [Thermococci archaeon]